MQKMRSPVKKGNIQKRKTSATLNKAQAAADYAAARHQKLSALLLGAKGLPAIPAPGKAPSPVPSMTSTLHSSPSSVPSDASTAVADRLVDEITAGISSAGNLLAELFARRSDADP
jgi:hypothetical protein